MNKSNSNQKANSSCNVNFGKVKDRSVKVYLSDKRHDGVEIIDSRESTRSMQMRRMRVLQSFVVKAET